MSEKAAKQLDHDPEKGEPLAPVRTLDPRGSIINIGTLRLDPTGSALIPPPASDPLDPLN